MKAVRIGENGIRATAKEVEALYPKYGEFLAIRRRVDPTNKFLNAYLRDIFA